MRLSTVHPPIPSHILEALADCGINSDTDLLFTNGTPSDIFLKLPQDSPITLLEISETVDTVIAFTSAPMFRGDKFLESQNTQWEKMEESGIGLNSGVKAVDELVGGFGTHKVIEISGDRGCGKTLLTLQIVLRHLSSDSNSSVVWVDTTGEFPSETLPSAMKPLSDQPEIDSALERLQISLAFELEPLQDILDMIRNSYSSNAESAIRCLVIDSITPLFRPLLSVVSSQGHAIMITFMRQLRALAEMCSLTIIVINSTSAAIPRNTLSAFTSTTRKPALGPSYTYMTDTTLWLSKWGGQPEDVDMDANIAESVELGTLFVAEILRSRMTKSRTWCPFRIKDGVLVDA